jgi:hypothetical protein
MLLGLCIFRNGQVFKNFRFNYMIDQKSNQADVYNVLRIDVIFWVMVLGFYLRSFEWVFCYYICLWSNRQWQNLHNGRRIR